MVGTFQAVFRRYVPERRDKGPRQVTDIRQFLKPRRMEAPAELVTHGLTVRFGGLTALDNASVRVKSGEVHALIGPNGAGKSTFVNTISGFYEPTEGFCELNGLVLTGKSSDEISWLGMARTFQNTELFGNMTVLDNVLVALDLRNGYGLAAAVLTLSKRRKADKTNRAVAYGIIDFVGLSDYVDETASSLPFGLQRRLEIARALATNPQIILLDEPAAGLTTQEIDALAEMILEIAGLGISVLLIEHHVDLIMAVSDIVTVLDYGKVIASDKPEEVQKNPMVAKAYLGVAPASQEVTL